jgi:hypothetical protein
MMVATLLIALGIASVAYAIGADVREGAGIALGAASLPPILGVLAIAGGVAFMIAS